MKTKMNKVLVLSLSAVLLLGATACERKGRAPLKAKTSAGGGVSTAADKDKGVAPTTTDGKKTTSTEKPIDSKYEVSLKETDLLIDSQMKECKRGISGYNIDLNGNKTVEDFKSDVETLRAYNDCMKANGLTVTQVEVSGTKNWKLLSAANPEERSPAFLEFMTQATKTGSNDDVALKVMRSRLELSILLINKIVTKYDAQLKGDETFKLAGKDFTVDPTMASFRGIELALAAAREDFKSFSSTPDGVDLAKQFNVAADEVTAKDADLSAEAGE